MNAKKNFSGLHKATAFIENLVPSLIDELGFPTLTVKTNSVDVTFSTYYVIRDLIPLHRPGIEYRMYATENHLELIYTFYDDED